MKRAVKDMKGGYGQRDMRGFCKDLLACCEFHPLDLLPWVVGYVLCWVP